MVNILNFETEREKARRIRSENISKEYLSYAPLILQGKITPNRVFMYLAERYDMTEDGVRLVVKRAKIYQGAKKPVCYPEEYKDKQLSLGFAQGQENINL